MSKSQKVEGKAQGRTCWNCRWLSPVVTVEFASSQKEARVTCLQDQWKRGSVMERSLARNPERFRRIAARCSKFEESIIAQTSAVQTEMLDTDSGGAHLTKQM